ncbi:hypothetical protein MTR67_039783 [Solanum verrucosum]|uniref:Uncharacterized protein n=1 Tax=Solanum verrucosum TaxID=315347 RepID=A0AAF0ZQS0_SOLVR|nr:hypothetical protein MTR67_039783 [Solanum verrucosum]
MCAFPSHCKCSSFVFFIFFSYPLSIGFFLIVIFFRCFLVKSLLEERNL